MSKGKYLGKCNRSSCLIEPAEYYNSSTQKYYCETCALLINEVNDVILCTKGKHDGKD